MFVPRTPKNTYNSIVGLPRLFDKMRAHAAGTLGEYKVGDTSELDRQIKTFLQFDFDDVLPHVQETSSDEDVWNLICQSIAKRGNSLKTEEERNVWSEFMLRMKLKEDPERIAYRDIVIEKMKLPEDITTFDWICMGDVV